jgi:hypothetical protein
MKRSERLGGQNTDGGIAVGQANERQRLLQRVAHGGHRFLLDRRLDHRRRARRRLVAELHGGTAARLRIGTLELQARLIGIEERLDGDAQPAVGGDLDQAGQRHRAQRLSVVGGCDLDDLGVALGGLGAAHHNLGVLGLAARVHVAVAQRGEELQPLRIPGPADHGDGRLALVRVVDDEIGERLDGLGGLRVARRRTGEPRHDQQHEQSLHQAFF